MKPPLKVCILWIIYKNNNLATTGRIRQELNGLFPRKSITRTLSKLVKEGSVVKKFHATYAVSVDCLPTVKDISKAVKSLFNP